MTNIFIKLHNKDETVDYVFNEKELNKVTNQFLIDRQDKENLDEKSYIFVSSNYKKRGRRTMEEIFICAKCGKEVKGIRYKDDYYVIEEHYDCPYCGYRSHWAYGELLPNDSDYGKNDGGLIISLKQQCSLQDTTILRNLILENPSLPLLVFVGEEANSGQYVYEARSNSCSNGSVKELTLYKNSWVDKEDYEDELINDCSGMEEFESLTDEEFYDMIDKKVEETEFVKAICVYVG